MKCMQTIGGVLAIVGLGYLAGVGQALIREKPVILGVSDLTIPVPAEPSATPQDNSEPTASQGSDDSQSSNIEHDPQLDAPVPEGMLTLRQARDLWNDGAYFVDARLRHEYDEGHISGAAYLTAETFFTPEGEAQMTSIPPDATVVVYCIGGEECDASRNTMALLAQSGFTDLHIMGVGYDEWAAAGLETETSP